MRLDSLSSSTLTTLKTNLETYISTGGGVDNYAIEGRRVNMLTLPEAVALLADVTAALARQASGDAIDTALVDFGQGENS